MTKSTLQGANATQASPVIDLFGGTTFLDELMQIGHAFIAACLVAVLGVGRVDGLRHAREQARRSILAEDVPPAKLDEVSAGPAGPVRAARTDATGGARASPLRMLPLADSRRSAEHGREGGRKRDRR